MAPGAAYAAFQERHPDATRTEVEVGWALAASGETEASAEWLDEISPRWARGLAPDPFYEPLWNGRYHELRFEAAPRR